MAFRDTWHRALVYFGLAEDREYMDDDEYYDEPATSGGEDIFEEPRRERRSSRSNVRRLESRRQRRDEIDDIFADDEPAGPSTRVLRPVETGGNGNGGADVQVHLVSPNSFNDAQ